MTAPDPLDLPAILAVEPLGGDRFRGHSPQTGWKRVFGGQVVAQALRAACHTVAGRPPHSLHAYFILAGDLSVSIDYTVERTRDGRSFATRRVTASQRDRPIFILMASFHDDEAGYEHQQTGLVGDGPPDAAEWRRTTLPLLPAAAQTYFDRPRPIELRSLLPDAGVAGERAVRVWFRVASPLPDDPVLHRCALAYASDMTLLDAAMAQHGRTVFDESVMGASLDHGLWFHRPLRADDWLLYTQDSPNLSGGRGFSRGLIHSADGRLVASAVQEGLLRPRRRLSPTA